MQQHAASLLKPAAPSPLPKTAKDEEAEMSEEQRNAVELMAPLIAKHGDKFLAQVRVRLGLGFGSGLGLGLG